MISIASFLLIGFYLCFSGVLLGGILGLLNKRDTNKDSFGLRAGRFLTSAGLLLGFLASAGFLFRGAPSLTVLDFNTIVLGKLVLDKLSAIFFLLISGVGFLANIYGYRYVLNEKEMYNPSYLAFMSSLFVFGMLSTVLANTPATFLFSWELMSFSSFLLVMADFKEKSVRAALFYLVMTHLGAGAIMAAFLLISGGLWGVDFTQLSLMAQQLSPVMALFVCGLFFFGFGSKAGLFPFHGWLPEAHPQAPSHISALMSGVMLKVAVYGFMRLVIGFFPALPLWFGVLVVVIGLCSAVFGVFYSLIETDVKRILAYSSIENLGLIFAMLGIAMIGSSEHIPSLTVIALLAAMWQILCHAVFKSGLFMSAGVLGQIFHTRNIEKMGGVAKKFPWFGGAALLLVLTAAALPPTGGFIAELLMIKQVVAVLMTASVVVRIVLVVFLAVLGLVAGMAVYSMVRFLGFGFLAEARSNKLNEVKKVSHDLIAPIGILALIGGIMGAFAKQIIDLFVGASVPTMVSSIEVFGFNPMILLVVIVVVGVLILAVRRLVSDTKNERLYHTWDCGQPIDASMEYTATAFSAPVRYFFKPMLRADRRVEVESLSAVNPWLRKKRVNLVISPLWDQYFYNPILRLVEFLSVNIRKLQNGNIQFYICLILISLIITAIVTL